MSGGPHVHYIDSRGGQHHSPPPRSLLILPLLAILSITCLIFSEVEYLLPISRLLQTSDETLPHKQANYQDFWLLKDLKPLTPAVTETNVEVVEQEKEEAPQMPAFDRIVLLGERHSGTSYTTQMLNKCFPDLDVSDFLVRYKHWFQPTPDYVINVTKTFLQNDAQGVVHDEEDMHKIREDWPKIASLENPKTVFNKTLVIAMFRNSYDWLEAMRLGPHHWTNHFDMYRFPRAPVPETTGNPWYGSNYLSWKDFLAANMTIGTNSSARQLCQNAYTASEVSPCRVSKDLYPQSVKKDYGSDWSAMPDNLPFNGHNPIYEMDANGKPFGNPLELRTAKMRNLMDIPNVWDVGGFMTLQHEQVNEEGSGFLLEQVSNIVGMQPSCEPDPPKHQEMKVLDGDWTNWISDNADWELEGSVGYKRRASVVKQESDEVTSVAAEKATSVAIEKPNEAKAAGKGTRKSTKSKTSRPDTHAVKDAKSSLFDRIVLLGERHSGTSYTTRMLEKCFPGLDVSDFLVRYKHWFQPTPEYVVNVTRTFLKNNDTTKEDEDMHKIHDYWPKLASLENPKSAFNKTLVIVMFRNVYDWLEAMRIGPHHWNNHFTMYRFENAPVPDTEDNPWYGSNYLPWKEFLAANMTIGNGNGFNESHLCQNAYKFGSISPCRVSKELYPDQVKKDYQSDLSAAPDDLPFNAHNPIYELNANGKPFDNPLELRTAKIRNFMNIPNSWDVGGFMTLQHEDVNAKGSGFLLDQVSKIVGLEPSCGADPPKNQGKKVLNTDWANWISQHADWETEGLLGYKKRESV